MPKSTVQDTIFKASERTNQQSAPRSGRPRQYTARDERYLLRVVRENPKYTYRKLKDHTKLNFSRKTLWRILHRNGITNWRAKKRPFLTNEVAAKRLAFAKKYVLLTKEEWAKIIWSDECSVERGSGKDRSWVFRQPHQKWDREMIDTYKKGKDISVMVWAAFSGALGRSSLYVMDRDPESKKGGYSARSYLKVLEENIPRCWDFGLTFIQDNAPIHCAKVTKKYFRDLGIGLLEWPPYNPDLNPIEHLWWHLKKLVYQVRPDIKTLTGEEVIREALEGALEQAWELIDQEIFNSVLDSMHERCQAVIAADGWHTKY